MRIATLPALALLAVSACATPAANTKPVASLTAVADQKWMPLDPAHPEGARLAVIWGGMKGPTGFLFRVPEGFDAGLHSHSSDYFGTVIAGRPAHGVAKADALPHDPGSTWFQPGSAVHYDRCVGPEECLLMMVFPRGPVDFIPYGRESASP